MNRPPHTTYAGVEHPGAVCASDPVYPGVWRVRLGDPEPITPASVRPAAPADASSLPPIDRLPLALDDWHAEATPRGFTVELPFPGEACFGLGLQFGSTQHRGRKRRLSVNSDPPVDTGSSHAPVPLLVSSEGFGLLFDTARVLELYIASHAKPDTVASEANAIATDTESLYGPGVSRDRGLLACVPVARGVDVYVIAGPTPRDVVRRYNLYSGGGCLPPLKALGVWYRAYAKFDDGQSLALARQLRKQGVPCDVFGLEPGWQSSAYPCSFEWDPGRFPDPDRVIAELEALGFELNLWEHAYLAAGSPLRKSVGDRVGKWAVFEGAMPDLLDPDVRDAFAEHHRERFVTKGVAGFKLDECDGSDFKKRAWSFPDHERFPSGIDGEQMRSLLGLLYQRSIHRAFVDVGRRTLSQVRSSGPFATSLPFILYSDLYDHRVYVRGLCSAGWSGLLWCPEVRRADSSEELIRRIQTAVLSPQALLNVWQFERPPWEVPHDDLSVEQTRDRCVAWLRLRMRLVPYLYAAFARYHREGLPPVRCLAMDWPDDPQTHGIEDAYLLGDDLLVVALFAGERTKRFYLPQGAWHHLFTGEVLQGGQWHRYKVGSDDALVFVRAGSLVPLARPVASIHPQTVFDLDVFAYGDAERASAQLWEDDGVSLDPLASGFNEITLTINGNNRLVIERHGVFTPHCYRFNPRVLHDEKIDLFSAVT